MSNTNSTLFLQHSKAKFEFIPSFNLLSQPKPQTKYNLPFLLTITDNKTYHPLLSYSSNFRFKILVEIKNTELFHAKGMQ